ncbi:uncharacterized protein EV154DRAFT_425059 [Mucor mucedo]|uniref:uncharacterized protein n=1 Tax=Mucor mucedo TaxID=29922 RepID=UPI00221FC563|nr:uncharacterized protein EV154DRAFT_425059 [Mucor mucedo]KAI7888833.1 hypothetical protein EV154DRAFT_425059 [Mucor mucedo]
MLKEADEYDAIIKASSLDDVTLSKHAQTIINAFKVTLPSTKHIRSVLRTHGNPVDFDLFEHADFGFIETTTRHFMVLVESPRNPLLGSINGRTTAIHTTTIVLNQLFISFNDVLALYWIEKEHCTTKKRKWDGVIVSVKDQRLSISLVEFSGGINSNNTQAKEKHDITKLYNNMVKVIENIPEEQKKQVFAVRFFSKIRTFISRSFFCCIPYIRDFILHNDNYIRCEHSKFECPTTARSLLKYVEEVPNMLKWRDAVVNHALQN